MIELSSRLRELLKHERTSTQAAALPDSRPAADPADALGGRYLQQAGTPCLIVEREYLPTEYHGATRLRECAEAAHRRDQLPVLAGKPFACLPDAPLVFLDIETTGLAGGAGTYAFLVGCGVFDDEGFRTWQVFMCGHGAERALLDTLSAHLGAAGAIVTFNGKTFDVPVIETRYLFHRMAFPLGRLPHLDMLHTARRLWRREGSCALQALEQALLGVTREGDVPGAEIPSRYLHYIRTGDVRPLVPVLHHNRLDLLSLAVLTVRAIRMAEDGPAVARDACERLGLGGLYDRAGLHGRARECYVAAAGEEADREARLEALRRLALQLRRERRYHEAAAIWQQVVDLGGERHRTEREALEALAIYHEHRSRDLRAAFTFATRAAHTRPAASNQAGLDYRLERLKRKLAREGDESHRRDSGGALLDTVRRL
jgi:uncharacterized protein YprB with RNaseH-like and TPR domain